MGYGTVLTPKVIAAGIFLLAIIWYYCFVPSFGPDHSSTTIGWLIGSWNPKTDYEHGKLAIFIILGMLFSRHKEIKASISEGTYWGLLAVVIGCFFFYAGFRTLQPRITVGGLPFILWGGVLFLWGWRVALLTMFPLFFVWITIPLPTFQQATTHLQLLATLIAHHGSNLLGVETYTQGTTILPVKGDWKPLSIAHGCSGIRSLMALLMFSAAWAYLARMSFWKRVVLFLSAVPLAIIGNSLRVISIFLIAEFGDANWAATTWHDWSGLLLFYPFSLFMLLVIHSVLEGGLPWKVSKKRTLRRVTVSAPESDTTKPSS
jgi:exosortase